MQGSHVGFDRNTAEAIAEHGRGRVVARCETDEQLCGARLLLQRAQDLRQWAGAQLRASAGAGRECREADLFACEHQVSLGSESDASRSRTS